MELQSLIDALTGGSAQAILALLLALSLWTNKWLFTALRDSWKARLDDVKQYTQNTEKLIERGQGEK